MFLIMAGPRAFIEPDAAPDVPYELGTVPFDYDWPTAPTTTGTTNVTTIGQFQTAVATSGYIINVAAGTYTGNLDVTGSDLDIRISNSANITGNVVLGSAARSARVKITGGNFVDGMFKFYDSGTGGIDDLLMDDVYINSDATFSGDGHHEFTNGGGWSRHAWINCTVGIYNANSLGGWCFYANMHGFPEQTTQGSCILANVKFISDAQNNRMMQMEDLIIVDSVFNPDNASVNGWRLAQGSNDVFMRDTTVVSSIQFNSGSANTNVTLLRMTNYTPYGNTIVHGVYANTGSMTDSTFYHSTGGVAADPTPLTDGGGNQWLAWDHSTLPDFSAYGAVRP
jgi:hypothetical protein